MKNYIGFSKDASSSMGGLRQAAIKDYNANITAVKDAATNNMLDTIVFANRFDNVVTREVVNSNPHVLKPLTSWHTGGMTALYDGIYDLIQQMQSVPDANDPNVSFLIMATTDGGENASNISATKLAEKIAELQHTDRWTFVVRVPKGQRSQVNNLGIPAGNIQEWDTTTKGMEESAKITTQAMTNFYATRAAGAKSSTVFYADASNVDTSALLDVKDKVSLYVVPDEFNGRQIRDFILTKRQEYLKGAAFYQLTKTEARVSHTKMIMLRVRSGKDMGKIFAGKEARTMIGLPTNSNARLHPGDHGNFDIFIQSESVNRHLVAGTGVIYWKEQGVPFTQAELDKFNGVAPKAPAGPVVLPAVPVTNKPTPSPLKKKPIGNVQMTQNTPATQPLPIMPVGNGRVRYHMSGAGAVFFATRKEARQAAKLQGKRQYDQGSMAPKMKRFYIA